MPSLYTPFRIFTFGLVLCSSVDLHAQVDIVQYVSDDLFEVQPVIEVQPTKENEKVSEVTFFEEDIQKGLDMWKTGESDDALAHFKQLGRKYSTVPLLPYYAGSIYYQNGHLEEAREQFMEALAREPLFLEAKYMIGLLEIASKNLKEAKKIMDILVGVPAYASYGYHGHALVATEMGNFQKAVKMYKRCLETDSTFREAYISLAYLELVRFRNQRLARKIMDRAVEIDKTWEQAIVMRGIISLFTDKSTDQFEKDLNRLISLSPSNYHYLSLRGFLNIELGNYRLAVDDFRKAFNLEIDSVDVGEYKFSTRLERSKAVHDGLNYYYDHRVEMEKKSKEFMDRGICELIRDEKDKALIFFDSAIVQSDHSSSYFFKGVIYDMRWDGEPKAIDSYSDALERDSTNYHALSHRAQLYMKARRNNDALRDYSSFIRLRPRLKEGYKNRGILELTSQKYRRAYRDFSAALMIDSSDYDLYYDRAVATMYMKHYTASIKDLNIVVAAKPGDYESYYMLYLNYLNLKDSAEAIRHLDSASKYGKYRENYHLELLALSKRLKRDDLQINAYDRLVKYHWQSNKYLYSRAMFHYRRKEYNKAYEDFTDFVRKEKKDAKGYYYLGMTQIALDMSQEGEKSLAKARKYGFKEE